MEAGGGVDFGDGIKQPLGIETEALILDFDRLKNIFKNKFNEIKGFESIKSKIYEPLHINLEELKIDIFNFY